MYLVETEGLGLGCKLLDSAQQSMAKADTLPPPLVLCIRSSVAEKVNHSGKELGVDVSRIHDTDYATHQGPRS